MQATTTRPKITATADGEGVVSHAGSRLLADVADKTTLTGQHGEALGGLPKARARHDPGQVLMDMAVAVADGATTISDVAALADQAVRELGCRSCAAHLPKPRPIWQRRSTVSRQAGPTGPATSERWAPKPAGMPCMSARRRRAGRLAQQRSRLTAGRSEGSAVHIAP